MTQKQKQIIEEQKEIIKELKETIKKQNKKPTIDEMGFKMLYQKQSDKVVLEVKRNSPNKFEYYSIRLTDLRTNHGVSMVLEDWEAENLMFALKKEFTIVPQTGKPYHYPFRKIVKPHSQTVKEKKLFKILSK